MSYFDIFNAAQQGVGRVHVLGSKKLQTEEPLLALISIGILQCCSYQNHQSPVYDMKWGHFDRVNSTFKMLISFWNFDMVFKKIRSFDAENLGSVD